MSATRVINLWFGISTNDLTTNVVVVTDPLYARLANSAPLAEHWLVSSYVLPNWQQYEARAESTDYGGSFLNMACNGLGVLKELQLDEQATRLGSPIPRMVIWSGNGKRLGEVRNGARAEVGAPSINILRSRLHQVLRQGAERQGIKMAFGKKLVGLSTDAQGVIATFEDRMTAEGDYLIGCDGVYSRTRQLINPGAPTPQYTSLISTGGFASHSSFAPTPNTMHFVFGKLAFFGYHVSASGDLYWFVNFPQKAAPARGEFDMIVSEEWRVCQPKGTRLDLLLPGRVE